MSILKQTDNEIRKYLSNAKLSDVCRTCLARRSKMNSIYSPVTNKKHETPDTIIAILMYILNTMPADQHPDKICSLCTRRLLRMHRMHQQCLRADRLLRESPGQVCVKAESSEDEGDVAGSTAVGEMGWGDGIKEKSKNDDSRTSSPKVDLEVESRVFDCSTTPEATEIRNMQVYNRNGAGVHPAPMDGAKKTKRGKKKIRPKEDEVDSSFVCDECGDTFTKKRTLAAHVRTAHSAAARALAKTYSCATCNKQFTNSTSLRIHHKMHLGIKDSMCHICGVRMRHSGALARHMRSHTAATARFQCGACGRRYRSSQALREHGTKHTGEKRATCAVCGLRVAHSGRLRWHMRRHSASSREECERCGRTFCSPAALRQHGLLHDNENAYCCSACGRKFSKEKHLIKHEQFHTGERPYLCDICGHAFAHPKTLRNHKKTHNKVKHLEVAKAKEDADKTTRDATDEIVFQSGCMGSELVANT